MPLSAPQLEAHEDIMLADDFELINAEITFSRSESKSRSSRRTSFDSSSFKDLTEDDILTEATEERARKKKNARRASIDPTGWMNALDECNDSRKAEALVDAASGAIYVQSEGDAVINDKELSPQTPCTEEGGVLPEQPLQETEMMMTNTSYTSWLPEETEKKSKESAAVDAQRRYLVRIEQAKWKYFWEIASQDAARAAIAKYS